jgi:hypothetical protein
MRLGPKIIPILLIASTAIVSSQQVREQPPQYSGPVTIVPGVFVTPIAGVPFSATVMIESKQPLADGTVETRVTQTDIARDSRGRIRNERHMLMPAGTQGVSPLIAVHVFDPGTRISYIFNPATMIAREQLVPPPRRQVSAGEGDTKDLGFSTLNGFQARGTRATRQIPAPASGTGKTVAVTDEFWYSEELHMNLLEEHTDVRGGKQTLAILSIKRDEPAPTLFEIPAGYRIVDMTPQSAPIALPAATIQGPGR